MFLWLSTFLIKDTYTVAHTSVGHEHTSCMAVSRLCVCTKHDTHTAIQRHMSFKSPSPSFGYNTCVGGERECTSMINSQIFLERKCVCVCVCMCVCVCVCV